MLRRLLLTFVLEVVSAVIDIFRAGLIALNIKRKNNNQYDAW